MYLTSQKRLLRASPSLTHNAHDSTNYLASGEASAVRRLAVSKHAMSSRQSQWMLSTVLYKQHPTKEEAEHSKKKRKEREKERKGKKMGEI